VRIGIDAMGGDNAPDAILDGAVDALQLLDPEDTLVLVGNEEIIRDVLQERGIGDDAPIEIIPSSNDIEMLEAIRNKKESSLIQLAEMSKKRAGDKKLDITISAGNTGACVAAAQMSMRRLPGVHRPGIAIVMPTFFGPVVICDVGANPEPRPTHLHQYGHMGAVYANRVLGIENPRVAVLSIGSEETKGNALAKEANQMMKADPSLNYVGYAEGRDIFNGMAEVIITEGFTGNVVLKLAEGLSSGIFRTIAQEVFEIDPELAMRFEPVVKSIYAKHDYHEYGGAPLLGANGIYIICHGSSEARTIYNAVRAAKEFAKDKVNEGIVELLAKLEEQTPSVEEEAV